MPKVTFSRILLFGLCNWLIWLILLPAFGRQSGVPVQDRQVSGSVRSEAKELPLRGVLVQFTNFEGRKVAETLTDENGRFETRLQPGTYRIKLSLKGFISIEQEIQVRETADTQELTFLLKLLPDVQTIQVTGDRGEGTARTSEAETLSGRLADITPLRGDNFQAMLPLVPGVIRGPDGRINVKGAGPTQTSLIVNSANATDPSTGNFGFELPIDAIETVELLANPYAAEFGRFSSGVARITTRRGEDRWRFSANNFIPRFKFRDGHIMGIGGFTPRFGVRGPIVPGRLFLAQNLQYRMLVTRVPALPVLKNDTRLESFDSFTRFDAFLSTRHFLVATLSVFPRKIDFVNLNTFNPQSVTPNFHQRGYQVGALESAALSPTSLLETSFSWRTFDANIFGQGTAPMGITPEGNTGNFFNRQERRTSVAQITHTLSNFRKTGVGEHLIKVGLDLMTSRLDLFSRNQTVDVFRADTTLHTRIDYSPTDPQRVSGTDVAFFLQDNWRLNDRFSLETGVRIDRDAVPGTVNFSPRIGFALNPLPGHRGVFRGGVGMFYDRTPLNVGAFARIERPTVTRFEEDGLTAAGTPLLFSYRADGLRTPYGLTWNIEYDHRLTEEWYVKVNHLQRNGHQEHLLDLRDSTLSLQSRGRSRYRELELSLRYFGNEDHKMIWSYVRSRSEADLNAFDLFFGNFRNPIIRPNEYSRTSIDTPNRFLYRAVITAPYKLIVSPFFEARSGFPFSKIDQYQNFVGKRNNGGRFPRLASLDVGIVRAVPFFRWEPKVGVRVYNLLNSFNPRDVQSNIDSPAFGNFYNGIPRQWGLTLQFDQ